MMTNLQLTRNILLSWLWFVALATFGTAAYAQIEMFLETPAEGEQVASVLFVRGWATAPSGIDRVELVINGVSPLGTIPFLIPLGESRPDVESLFPNYPGSANSGFNIGFFFTNSAYPFGANTVTVTAYDKTGISRSVSHVFILDRFETSAPNNFYRNFSSTGRFSIASARIEGDSILIQNAIIDNQTYDVRLKFNRTLQTFSNYEILKVAGPPKINIASGLWGRGNNCMNVSGDRTKLTVTGSQCPEGASLYLFFTADRCNFRIWTKEDIPIIYNTFNYKWNIVNSLEDFIIAETTGVFDSPTTASGSISGMATCRGFLIIGTWGWSMSP